MAGGATAIEIAERVETAKAKAKRWWSERRALRTKVALLPTNPISFFRFVPVHQKDNF